MVDYSKMSLEMLKVKAQELSIKGRSKMNKAELVEAITEKMAPELADEAEAGYAPSKLVPKQSMVEMIKSRIREAKEWRSNSGREAARYADATPKKSWQIKDLNYRLQRGSETARLTPRQARRVRKAERLAGTVEYTYR